ncbi:sugar transporter SWEET1 [Chrysoperla carnea]|uniref:sugar transporter SWEET1 n=1 Tax=Chrysoperla carnea TaxID=189513 RepID=UPI001D06F2B4|nr:sugar transporter SWEET1 [Chrysoperla carnea]XP_044734442.1 sugar transporter SWEET1 [Chrysoperla carnea]XP_044734444.1 sugar transporter SWEET1 [Chrysoperla carnea]XP_044734445.1 sugar transporter SWEET1 [Chrysoperla carnea]
MEALSEILQPYKDVVGLVASVLTIGQFFSGVLICKEIYDAKSTQGKSAMPFIGGTVLGIIMLQYSLILDDINMLRVNIAGILLNIFYMTCFYLYCENKKKDVIKPLLIGLGIATAVYFYIKIEDPQLIEYRLGLFVTIALMGLIASPLFNVAEIIKKRNAETMPMPIIFSGTVVTIMWTLYGIILKNEFMLFQNMIGIVLSALQILLYIFFRGGVKEDKKKE